MTASSHRIRRFQTSAVGGASLVAAGSGFLILFAAARVLPPADNAEFLAFWAGLFAIIGILGGVTTETTRGVGALSAAGPSRSRGASVMVGALIVGGVLAVLVMAIGLPFADRLSGTRGLAVIGLLALTSMMFAVQAALAGALQGMLLWDQYARQIALEAVLRIVAVLMSASLGGTLFGIEVACLAGLLTWPLMLALSRRSRAAALSRSDAPLGLMLRRTGHAILTAAASAALIVSFPILVKLTTSPRDYALAAPLLLAIMLTRAPIMLPLQAFQGMVITSIVNDGGRGLDALRRPIVLVSLTGILGAGAAALVGPWLMLWFGPDYHVGRAVLAVLTLASAIIAVLTLTGTGLLALGRHRACAAGWVIATSAAVICLMLPFTVELRCVLALTVGPLMGISIHVAALRGWFRT